MDRLFNLEIILLEVRKSISKLKTGKSYGTDGIPAEFYKSTIDSISTVLVLLFNKIFDTGVIPHLWLDSSFSACS